MKTIERKKKMVMSRMDFAREWIKAVKYKIESGDISLKEYIDLLKTKIIEIKN